MWIYIIGFGVLGVSARFGLEQLFSQSTDGIPWVTFSINIFGSLLAGWFIGAEFFKAEAMLALRTGLLVGFCGGFTTFSAYALRSWQMLETGAFGQGLFYLIASPVLGLAAVALGLKLAQI